MSSHSAIDRRVFIASLVKLLSRCLRPLVSSHEIQVHDRCLNCSAVLGIYLLPAVCDFGCTILNHPSVGWVDVALLKNTEELEYIESLGTPDSGEI